MSKKKKALVQGQLEQLQQAIELQARRQPIEFASFQGGWIPLEKAAKQAGVTKRGSATLVRLADIQLLGHSWLSPERTG